MLGNAWSSPADMPLSSSLSADETALEQLQHLRHALLPYDHSGLELSGMFSPFPPPPVTMAVAPGDEANSLPQCGLLMPPTAVELQAEAVARLGLNLGARTCFRTSPDGELIPLEANPCWWSGGDAEAGEGGVCGGLSGSEGVLYTSGARCQAEGCCADLAKAKQYHRRHKVCEFHSKAAVVVAHGLTQRFCQQCSRFHVLSEFDQGKRSCRKRLAEHNRRRRKSQALPPPSTQASAATIASPPDPASDEPSGGCDESMAVTAAAEVAPASPWMAMECCLGHQEGSPAANSSCSSSSPTSYLSSPRSSSTSAPPQALHYPLYSQWAPMFLWEAEPTREYWN